MHAAARSTSRRFDVADVERVEIARGPYSAVYGGDALAGVINIVTRHAPRGKGHASRSMPWVAATTSHEIAVECRRPGGRRRLEHGRQRHATRASQVRGNEFDGATRFRQFRFRPRRVHHGRSSPGATRKPSARVFPTTAAAMNSRKSATPSIATRTKSVFGAGLTHRRRRGDVRACTLGYFDRDDHIDSPGVAPGIRDPFGVPPEHGGHRTSRASRPRFTGTQKFSDVRVAGLRRRVAARRRRAVTARSISAAASCCPPRSSSRAIPGRRSRKCG